MNIQVKSSNGITLVPVDARLMADRKIFVEGEINQETACAFVKKICCWRRKIKINQLMSL